MNYFDQYKLAFDLLEKESDRFWSRNNVFLYIQAALIAFYTNLKDVSVFRTLLTVEGFFLALMWVGVLIKGAKYVGRWDNVVRSIEKEISEQETEETKGFMPLKKLNDHSKDGESFKLKIKFINKRTTILISYLIYSLMIFWLVLFIANIIQIFFA